MTAYAWFIMGQSFVTTALVFRRMVFLCRVLRCHAGGFRLGSRRGGDGLFGRQRGSGRVVAACRHADGPLRSARRGGRRPGRHGAGSSCMQPGAVPVAPDRAVWRHRWLRRRPGRSGVARGSAVPLVRPPPRHDHWIRVCRHGSGHQGHGAAVAGAHVALRMALCLRGLGRHYRAVRPVGSANAAQPASGHRPTALRRRQARSPARSRPSTGSLLDRPASPAHAALLGIGSGSGSHPAGYFSGLRAPGSLSHGPGVQPRPGSGGPGLHGGHELVRPHALRPAFRPPGALRGRDDERGPVAARHPGPC